MLVAGSAQGDLNTYNPCDAGRVDERVGKRDVRECDSAVAVHPSMMLQDQLSGRARHLDVHRCGAESVPSYLVSFYELRKLVDGSLKESRVCRPWRGHVLYRRQEGEATGKGSRRRDLRRGRETLFVFDPEPRLRKGVRGKADDASAGVKIRKDSSPVDQSVAAVQRRQ